MSVITAVIDLGSLSVLSMSGIFILTFRPRVGFWSVFRRSCFHFLCLLLKSFPGSLSKHFHVLSSADGRSCPTGGFRDCFRAYFFYFELRSPLPMLRRFLLPLYYHYLAIPNQELVCGLCLSFIELYKINDCQNILNLQVQ